MSKAFDVWAEQEGLAPKFIQADSLVRTAFEAGRKEVDSGPIIPIFGPIPLVSLIIYDANESACVMINRDGQILAQQYTLVELGELFRILKAIDQTMPNWAKGNFASAKENDEKQT